MPRDVGTPVNNPAIASTQALVDQVAVRGLKLFGFHAFNSGAAANVQLFDSAASIATGDRPIRNYPIGASLNIDVLFPAGNPRAFTNGILLVGSTSPTSYVSTGALFYFDVQHG